MGVPVLPLLGEMVRKAIWIDDLLDQKLLDFVGDNLSKPPEFLLAKLKREIDLQIRVHERVGKSWPVVESEEIRDAATISLP